MIELEQKSHSLYRLIEHVPEREDWRIHGEVHWNTQHGWRVYLLDDLRHPVTEIGDHHSPEGALLAYRRWLADNDFSG